MSSTELSQARPLQSYRVLKRIMLAQYCDSYKIIQLSNHWIQCATSNCFTSSVNLCDENELDKSQTHWTFIMINVAKMSLINNAFAKLIHANRFQQISRNFFLQILAFCSTLCVHGRKGRLSRRMSLKEYTFYKGFTGITSWITSLFPYSCFCPNYQLK